MERVSVMLKPDGFFTKNPALDVPPSVQSFNQSKLYHDAVHTANDACCSTTGAAGQDKAKLFRREE
jgi:primary-amine oxidase